MNEKNEGGWWRSRFTRRRSRLLRQGKDVRAQYWYSMEHGVTVKRPPCIGWLAKTDAESDSTTPSINCGSAATTEPVMPSSVDISSRMNLPVRRHRTKTKEIQNQSANSSSKLACWHQQTVAVETTTETRESLQKKRLQWLVSMVTGCHGRFTNGRRWGDHLITPLID